MKVLLVSPEFPDTFCSFRHALRFVRKRAAIPPLGLVTVAAMLPSEWEVRLVDLNVEPLCEAELRWADSVWIGGMSVQAPSALAVIQWCRNLSVNTVVGGPMATCEPERFAAARVYSDLAKPDLTYTPTPRWDLLKMRRYGSMSVQYSRGCPYDCDFCNVTALLGKRPRTKTPEQMVAELDALYRLGWRSSVFFVDDNLIGNRREVRRLLPALTAWREGKKPTPFYTEASINLADDAQLQQEMVAAGFDTVFVGIETPDETALAECHKKQNLGRDLVSDVRKLHRAGLQVQAGFIVGFDSDTPGIFQRQFDFIQQSGIVTAMVGVLQAPIGTRLFQSLADQGRLRGDLSGDNVDGTTNVVTKMPLDALMAGYRSIMSRVYAPDAYYQRVKRFLSDYSAPPVRAPLRMGLVAAFFRSCWRLGVLNTGRWQYWKLLAWTLTRRPQHFALAVRLWVYGHHFREVCRLRLGIPAGGLETA